MFKEVIDLINPKLILKVSATPFKSPADEHGRGSVFTVSFKAAALDDAAKKKLMTEQGAE